MKKAAALPQQIPLEQLFRNERQGRDSGGGLKRVMKITAETIWTVGPDLTDVFGLHKLSLRGIKNMQI